MKIIKNIHRFNKPNCAVALGTFDGVHLGHKRVISKAVEFSKKQKIPCVVVTFDPHPSVIIHKNKKTGLLTTISERAYFVSSLGVDYMLVLLFDKKFASTGYKMFVEKYLVRLLRTKAIFVGNDYTFGKNKEGNVAKLKKIGKKDGFFVFGVKDKIENNRVVKSTLIRTLIKSGKFYHAVNLLGHPYLVMGKVIKGHGIGRKIGFPTANLELSEEKILPKNGVYCGWALVNKKKFWCVANIGSRPTFGKNEISFEVHLIDFNKDITGKKISVFLIEKLRTEKEFDSIDALVEQIRKDINSAKKILSRISVARN